MEGGGVVHWAGWDGVYWCFYFTTLMNNSEFLMDGVFDIDMT